jgi:hypothetical protein
VWSGGHDTRLCAVDTSCSVVYQVGNLKETGDVAQAGGSKAILRRGYNVWTFGIKGITVYSAHCITTEIVAQVRSSA